MSHPAFTEPTASYPTVGDGFDDEDLVDDGPPEAEPEDLDAPWGRRADGTPRAKPGPKGPSSTRPANPARAARGRTRRADAPRRVTRPAAPPAGGASNSATKYARGLMDATTIPQGILAGIGMLKPAFMASAMTVQMFAAPISESVGEIAASGRYSTFTAWMDKLIQVTPFAALASVGAQFFAQIAVNHGLMAPGMMGTKHPKLLAAMMRHQMEDEMARQAEQMRAEQEFADRLANGAVPV
jgi:hypothetical protein